jgi:hypothetical protein
MAKSETKEKIVYEGKAVCPYCSRKIRQRLIKDILTPSVKAETQLRLISEKDEQESLNVGG